MCVGDTETRMTPLRSHSVVSDDADGGDSLADELCLISVTFEIKMLLLSRS